MSSGQEEQEKWQYLRAVFDAIPLPAFIVDAAMCIQDHNAAGNKLLGAEGSWALQRRGGEAFHCINSLSSGCGHSEACQDCLLRNSVNQACSGKVVSRQSHKVEVQSRDSGKALVIDLLVTSAPLPNSDPPRALLILEDVTELLSLRGLLPICAQCKKVRDDQQYWQSLDRYLQSHSKVQFTHGICPSCYQEQMKAFHAFRRAEAEG